MTGCTGAVNGGLQGMHMGWQGKNTGSDRERQGIFIRVFRTSSKIVALILSRKDETLLHGYSFIKLINLGIQNCPVMTFCKTRNQHYSKTFNHMLFSLISFVKISPHFNIE